MRRRSFENAGILWLCMVLVSCGSKEKTDPAAAAPPPAQVIQTPDLNIVKVDRPERFPVVTAGRREELPEIHVTGVVSPDVEKSVPVISLAAGRVVGIYAKLGDDVQRGQLLLKVLSNDIASGLQSYRQAKADEELTRRQLQRAQLLYDHGAVSLNDLQVAENAEQKTKVALDVATQQVRTLGGDVDRPDPVISIRAPISGTIVEQNVVASSAVHSADNQPNLFTIANLSDVWVICNVYENDLPTVALGETADIRLNAYDDRKFQGRINNIGKVLDANIRTAPVRIVLRNPGIMRAGMFATATFYGKHGRMAASIPTSAVLHLHDRDWVFTASGNGEFRRTEITTGKVTGDMQDVLSGIAPGQQVVRDALSLSAEAEQ
jgi:cobalt-zinc-cadmium efflux system membrane fusion protein